MLILYRLLSWRRYVFPMMLLSGAGRQKKGTCIDTEAIMSKKKFQYFLSSSLDMEELWKLILMPEHTLHIHPMCLLLVEISVA